MNPHAESEPGGAGVPPAEEPHAEFAESPSGGSGAEPPFVGHPAENDTPAPPAHAPSRAISLARKWALALWFFSTGLIVPMLFAWVPEGALACAAGWLATSACLIATARPGDSTKQALIPVLVVFAIITGFHVLWAATPQSWSDPATWTFFASIAETVLASAVLILRHAIASRRMSRLLCTGIVLATLALWYATGLTIMHYIIC